MDLIQSMRARMPLNVGRAILKSAGIPTGQGWDKTVEKYHELEDTPGGITAEAINQCKNSYIEHLQCGEKGVRIYELSDDEIARLRDEVAQFTTEDEHPFTENYPLLMDEADLDDVRDLRPHLIHIDNDASGTTLTFSAKRMIELRERLTPDELGEAVQDEFDGVEEIVTVRRGYKQAVDVIFIPSSANTVEVRVDNPKDMPHDYATQSQHNIRLHLNTILGYDALNLGRNLFNHIEKIYQNSDEGVVVEMAFLTHTASIKDEKMRKKNLDLREEIYHKAGTEAVSGNIEPFRLSVRWTSDIDGQNIPLEASLNSSVRELHSTSPTLTEIVIRGCGTKEQYDFVTSRVYSYF